MSLKEEPRFEVIVDNDRSGVTIKRCVHKMWAERERLRGLMGSVYRQYPYDAPYDRPLVGKWHYIFESKKGVLSIMELPDYMLDNVTIWEMSCLEGELFDRVEWYMTYVDAEIAARRYLQL